MTGDNLDTGLISCMHCGNFGKAFMVEVSAEYTGQFSDFQYIDRTYFLNRSETSFNSIYQFVYRKQSFLWFEFSTNG